MNWRDLNACPVSTSKCDVTRQPFGTRFPNYNHILQLNNDGYSNYNSLQAAFKVRDMHGLTGQLNFTWSRPSIRAQRIAAELSFPTIKIRTTSTRIRPFGFRHAVER